MRFIKFLLPVMIAAGSFAPVLAQTDTTATELPATEEQNDSKDQKDKKKEDKKAAKYRPENYKESNSLFEKKKTSWSIGAFGGLPFVNGDVAPQLGIGYGGYLRKSLGSAFSLRLIGANGYASGLGYSVLDWGTMERNQALNGTFDTSANYYGAKQNVYPNFRMNFTTAALQGVFSLNNVSFTRERPRFGLSLFVGVGAMMFDTHVDQLDGDQRYSYGEIIASGDADPKAIQSRLRSMLDGNYETPADGSKAVFMDRNLVPMLNTGAGLTWNVGQRIGIFLEAMYTFTGSDVLDGYRWADAGTYTSQSDPFGFFRLGVDIRLGRIENTSWTTNPLTLPYKTIMENKKKLQKVDKLEKDVENMGKKVDTLSASIDEMKTDSDQDGVSDVFDREPGSPEGAVVNGAGETIFFKDRNGNLVYNNPATGQHEQYMDPKTGTEKTRTVFDANDPRNKTVILQGDGRGGFNAPGTFSSIGYMPAIFFNSDQASVEQRYFPELYAVALAVKQSPNVKVRVIGYTDERASTEYNQQLGMRRANAVIDALVNYFGVPKSQLIAESKGEVEPLSNSKSGVGMAANRRVQFQVDGAGKSDKTPSSNNPALPPDDTGDSDEDVFTPDDF